VRGACRWYRLHIRPYRTADGRLDGAILCFLDVDALKRAAQTAEHARDYANGIVETVPIALVVLDESQRIVTANPPFHLGFGARPGALVRTELFALAAGALDQPALRTAIARSLAAGSPFRDLELQCALPERGLRDLVFAGCPIQGAEGEAMLLLAIEDVSERRLLEASEKQARVEAERANHAKDLFLATLSHELRTPLSTLMMSAHLLRTAAADNPDVRRASAAIERAVGSQKRLIDDLLDISRIVSGKLALDLQAVDLVAVVQSAVEVTQGTAQAKGLALELTLPPALRPVHGDPMRLQQVVANLLDNSVKFTPRGGRIAIRLEQLDGNARITVSDTGIGLSAEILPRLFDRFVQAESSMTRAHGGLGLGLAIVRHLVNVHGGEVSAESPGEGRGATFTLTLPLAAAEASDSTAAPTVSRSVRGIRVLLIEDDEDTRDSCARMLAEQGASVRTAASAAQGLEALEVFAPQVILCDIAMAGEDGYAFIRKVRDGARGRHTAAAALTALASDEERMRALELGFQLHLAKPIDADRLASAVATLAAWPKQAGSLPQRAHPDAGR
jgi:two-component system CheB/CheR fusion protein